MPKNKIKHLFKKEDGSVFLWTLMLMILVFILFAFFMSFTRMMELYQSTSSVANTVGKTRAQAVDIPLKEQYGIIEVISSDSKTLKNFGFTDGQIEDRAKYLKEKLNVDVSELGSYDENVRSNDPTPGYDVAILSKDSTLYKSSSTEADKTAKFTGTHTLLNRYKGYSNDKALISADEENFCVTVFPLPAGKVLNAGDFDISCDVIVDGVTHTVKAGNVKLYGLNHPLNSSTENANHTVENKNLQIVNAVFVGFAYKDNRTMFYDYLDKLSGGDTATVRKTYDIVYPQIDEASYSGWD